jgi:predicted TIM-barrel fold metal-dependent hydrolase
VPGAHGQQQEARKEANVKPVIDVHAHVFRGRDIPLKGFLLSRKYEWYIQMLAPILFRIIARCIRRGRTEEKGLVCGSMLELVYKYMGQGYRRWADILSIDEVADIASKMVQTFEKDGIDLYVPLMIDYEYWFKNTPEPSIASQIDAVYRDIVLPFKGAVHPFAPFDPARELAHRAGLPGPDAPDGGPPEKHSSLELAKDAIRNKGFIGVKVYNSLGYRPLGNAAMDYRRRWIFRHNRMGRYSAFTGEQFDQVLSELYTFCVQEQVPITAHCVSDGVEAYPGASFDFCSPAYWREVLDRFPDLHLNLAHFGWGQNQDYQETRRLLMMLRYRGKKTWVREVCEMLQKYRYLFTDVSHHGVVIESDIAQYKAAYKAMCSDFPGLIQKKLLYGIDWHVITRMDNFENFKDKYLEVLRDENLFTEEEIEDFLGGNALHFLGLLPLWTSAADGWTRNRKRLQGFYENNAIDPPTWFTSTDSTGLSEE